MRNFIVLIVALLSAGLINAQDVAKNKFVENGDLIEATLYHQNGTVAQTGFYTKENKLQGKWISFDVEGTKTATAHYENGAKVGVWFFYQGKIMKKVSYNDSKIASVKTFEIKDSRALNK